eukprot:6187358-Pleurochrysis_carterae.AAC.1
MTGDCRVNVLSPDYYGQPTKANRGTYLTFNHFTRTSRMQGRLKKSDLTIAGEQLLGLTGELASHWWAMPSPYCAQPHEAGTSVIKQPSSPI